MTLCESDWGMTWENDDGRTWQSSVSQLLGHHCSSGKSLNWLGAGNTGKLSGKREANLTTISKQPLSTSPVAKWRLLSESSPHTQFPNARKGKEGLTSPKWWNETGCLNHSAVVQNGEVPSVHEVRLMSLVRNTNSKDCDIQGIRDGPHLNF